MGEKKQDSMAKPKAKAQKNTGAVRIIAGRWRGRKLLVSDSQGLRPSPARLRETLFNWLSPYLAGSHCWDLFAGSGALGIEAYSRGAASVQLVEKNQATAQILAQQITLLGAEGLHIQQGDAQQWLAKQPQAVDIIFLDPPFGQNLLAPVCQSIAEQNLIKPGGWIYTETPSHEPEPNGFYPGNWQLHREKQAGQVRAQLLRVD